MIVNIIHNCVAHSPNTIICGDHLPTTTYYYSEEADSKAEIKGLVLARKGKGSQSNAEQNGYWSVKCIRLMVMESKVKTRWV